MFEKILSIPNEFIEVILKHDSLPEIISISDVNPSSSAKKSYLYKSYNSEQSQLMSNLE